MNQFLNLDLNKIKIKYFILRYKLKSEILNISLKSVTVNYCKDVELNSSKL